MKHIYILLIVAFLTFEAKSQRFIGSAILGGNLTQVEGDEMKGYFNFGLNGGAGVSIALNKKQSLFLNVELLYSQKGSKYKKYYDEMPFPEDSALVDWSYSFNKKIKYKLRLDYVEVPVLLSYEDYRTGCSFGLGFSWARLVYASEVENGYRLITNLRSNTYWNNDWSVLADVKIRLYKNLKLNFRFQYSFLPIREREFNRYNTFIRKQYNNVLTLRLMYTFNEKFKLNENKDKTGKRIGLKWIVDTKDSN